MTTDLIRLRSEFLNTQVITRNTGKRLGVVKEVLVDIDRREVVAFGLRDNILALSGMPKYMYLNSICQTGDVILVEDEDAIEDVEIERYSALINCEVITETGEPLGRVRDFQFNLEDGTVSSLIIASLGIPQIPEQVLSTYQLSIEEVVSSGPNRLIVFEGSEDRLTQLTVGLLERLGIGRPPWEREEEEMYYPPTAKPENQLGTGIPIAPPVVAPPVETRTPIRETAWDEDEWEETAPLPRRQAETIRYAEYDEDEEDNWGDSKEDYPPTEYETASPLNDYDYQYDDDNFEDDVWDDDVKPQPLEAPKINIPETKKEYEIDS
jgi:sporulation protein YlmC with PRC-barrel domain